MSVTLESILFFLSLSSQAAGSQGGEGKEKDIEERQRMRLEEEGRETPSIQQVPPDETCGSGVMGGRMPGLSSCSAPHLPCGLEITSLL